VTRRRALSAAAVQALQRRLVEAEQTLEAIRTGEVDSLVVEGPGGLRVYSLEGASASYRVMIEAISEGAATLTESGLILYCNGRLARMLDRPLQKVMGASMRDLVVERARPGLDALLRSALETDSRAELPMLAAGGQEVPAYLSVSCVQDDGQRVLCLIATDLREQKRSEDILAAEKLARSVLEQAAEAIIVCDEKGTVIRASGAAAELCGDNPLLRPFEEVFPIHGAGGSVAAAALEGRVLRAVPATLAGAGGALAEVLVSAAPLSGANGGTIGCVITLVDVTQSRRSEEALRESEARFRALADNISQLAWMANAEGGLFWFNRRWFEYTQSTPEAAQGWGWIRWLHPDHQERVASKVRRCLQSGEAFEDTFPLRGRDGQHRWFLARALPIKDDGGNVARWFGTNTDVTMHREAEEALRQAVSLRDQFLSVAAHELRTPITALSLQLEGLERLLLKEAGGNERALKKAQSAIKQVDRLGLLVEGLLNVSRIVSGHFELQLERFDLAEVVKETLDRMGDLAARAGCELRLSPGSSAVGTWDRSRLEQVVTNLITNAIKYGAGSPIDVTVEQSGGGVELLVQDRGIGIPLTDQERIFERFERAAPASHYGGLGLGLYISREIALAHGGTIQVQSTPGQGATFRVRLPLAARPWRRGAA
jgi:PAS domain S-box-containing protein